LAPPAPGRQLTEKVLDGFQFRATLSGPETDVEASLGPLRASQVFDNHSYGSIRTFDAVVELNGSVPGFLPFILSTSRLRRQAIFAAVPVLHRLGAKVVAQRLCHLAPAASLDAQARIAHAFMTAPRAREIVRATYGSVPVGFLGALKRIGDRPLSRSSLYRKLFDIFALREHRARARVLRQGSGAIRELQIDLLGHLDPRLLHPNVVCRIRSVDQAVTVSAALALVRKVVSTATEEAVRTSLLHLGKDTDFATSISRWLDRMDQPSHLPPITLDHPDFRPLTTGDAMRDARRRYKNCIAVRVPYVAAGIEFYVEWRHPPGAIVELRRLSDENFILTEIHGPENKPPEPSTVLAIRSGLAGLGIPGLSYGEGRSVQGVLRLLGIWGYRGDLGYDLAGGPDPLELAVPVLKASAS
jgi:hypothetical protein